MPVSKLSISLSPEVAAGIALRDDHNTSGAIDESLARWFEALRRARAELRPQFSEAEQALILDVCNGTIYEPYSIPLLWASVEDGIALDGLAAKWAIDGPALVARLRGLTYTQSAALVDGAERWWKRVSDGEQPPHTDLLA